MAVYDGPADFLTPDGEHLVVTTHASQRGEQWSGSIGLGDTGRRLEQGDVCRLTSTRFGELRVIITEQRGSRRYAFVALITPDPHERLGPPG
ncbi:MAG: hypothetical protein HYX51_02690 [Chloroflexi bacterium]|nr:hypothetical protein [Chloroflexota bacterium]